MYEYGNIHYCQKVFKVKFEGQRPKIGESLQTENGYVKKAHDDNLVIGIRTIDKDSCKDDEIWISLS